MIKTHNKFYAEIIYVQQKSTEKILEFSPITTISIFCTKTKMSSTIVNNHSKNFDNNAMINFIFFPVILRLYRLSRHVLAAAHDTSVKIHSLRNRLTVGLQ